MPFAASLHIATFQPCIFVIFNISTHWWLNQNIIYIIQVNSNSDDPVKNILYLSSQKVENAFFSSESLIHLTFTEICQIGSGY